jgi:hypothetical protein
VGFFAVSLWASVADAAPIVLGPSDTTCTSNDNSNPKGGDVLAKVQGCFGSTANALSLYYKANVGGGEEGSFASSYDTVFANTPSDPSDAFISYVGGLAISCPECYLVVKDGNHSPAVYFFNLSSWNGTDALDLQDFWPDKGAISNVAIWGEVQQQQVPEPVSLLLLGTGLGAAVLRLRRKSNG